MDNPTSLAVALRQSLADARLLLRSLMVMTVISAVFLCVAIWWAYRLNSALDRLDGAVRAAAPKR